MALTTIVPGVDTGFSTKLNNNFNAVYPWIKFMINSADSSAVSFDVNLLKFSDTAWATLSYKTSNGGSSWSTVTTPIPSGSYAATCFTGSNNGCAIINNSNTSKYTTDAGDTWSASTTAPANMTACLALAMGSSTIAVAGGNASSGKTMWYSSDGGNNWTQCATGPTTTPLSISMVSSSVGYLVDNSLNIWKTTDSGVTWTDTTHNSGLTYPQHIKALSATTCLIAGHTGSDNGPESIEYYDNSGGTVKEVARLSGGRNTYSTGYQSFTNFVTGTDGNTYIVFGRVNIVHVNAEHSIERDSTELFILYWNGTNMLMRSLGLASFNIPQDVWNTTGGANYYSRPSVLIEVANVLYLNEGTTIKQIIV